MNLNLKRSFLLSLFFLCVASLNSEAAKRQFYEIKIYTVSSSEQEQMLDKYLRDAYLPALHRMGINTVGVFKPRIDTEDAGKKVYVLTPLKNVGHSLKIEKKLMADDSFQEAGSAYINAKYDQKPYDRYETIILKAFEDAPQLNLPSLQGERSNRFYELRSYEGPTEKYYQKKVEMFNQGGEVKLFKKLNFNAVFYGEVVVGSHMPNLMYMTTFENKEDRDEHWKAFVDSPEWTTLKADPQYAHTVSKNNQYYLYPTDYSDI